MPDNDHLAEIPRCARAEDLRAQGGRSVADLEQQFQVLSMTIRRERSRLLQESARPAEGDRGSRAAGGVTTIG